MGNHFGIIKQQWVTLVVKMKTIDCCYSTTCSQSLLKMPFLNWPASGNGLFWPKANVYWQDIEILIVTSYWNQGTYQGCTVKAGCSKFRSSGWNLEIDQYGLYKAWFRATGQQGAGWAARERRHTRKSRLKMVLNQFCIISVAAAAWLGDMKEEWTRLTTMLQSRRSATIKGCGGRFESVSVCVCVSGGLFQGRNLPLQMVPLPT